MSSSSSSSPETPRPKHDWYQTETGVVIEVRVKDLSPDSVAVEFAETSVCLTAKLDASREHVLDLQLAHPINAKESTFKVLKTKVFSTLN